MQPGRSLASNSQVGSMQSLSHSGQTVTRMRRGAFVFTLRPAGSRILLCLPVPGDACKYPFFIDTLSSTPAATWHHSRRLPSELHAWTIRTPPVCALLVTGIIALVFANPFVSYRLRPLLFCPDMDSSSPLQLVLSRCTDDDRSPDATRRTDPSPFSIRHLLPSWLGGNDRTSSSARNTSVTPVPSWPKEAPAPDAPRGHSASLFSRRSPDIPASTEPSR